MRKKNPQRRAGIEMSPEEIERQAQKEDSRADWQRRLGGNGLVKDLDFLRHEHF
jgi:hypothetical protein